MKASEYKAFKGLRKESLRDNMSDIEVLLTDLGETAARELAKRGGRIAKNTRDNLEKELHKSVISNQNNLNYQYIDEKEKLALVSEH